jgi:ubiquinone/menaquinone biosynthesis C-methylase UbiE
MNIDKYNKSFREQERIKNLIEIMPRGFSTLLDIGARNGYISSLLTSYFKTVTALDLKKPELDQEGIICVKGDVTNLEFPDNWFDVILCCEVLEHIAPKLLSEACKELIRVSKHLIVIGVPYKQDIRLGRTTCLSCKRINPPWGHLNSFDEKKLRKLFKPLTLRSISFVGEEKAKTNVISTYLMDLVGNPWGTYNQEEPCVHCDKKLIQPSARDFLQKICSKIAFMLNSIEAHLVPPNPIWVHMVFEKA